MYLLLRADRRLKQNHKDVLLPAHPQKLYPLERESGLILSREDYSHIAYPVSKQLSTLLRHGLLPRQEDGAIEFWRSKEYLRNDLVQSQHWSDEKRKSTMAKGGGNKKKFQYCTDPSGQEILYLRALQGHSGRNLIDPSLQDNVLNSERFLRVHLSHRMCNQFTLHHEFRIDTRRAKFEQETDGILHVCGSYEQGTQRS